MGIDLFLAVYLLGAIVILGIMSIIAYKKQVERGEITDNEYTDK